MPEIKSTSRQIPGLETEVQQKTEDQLEPETPLVQPEKTMGELIGTQAGRSSSNTVINLFFNCPKSHSVPYSLKVGNDNAATQWVVIQPGITTSIPFDVWERIKDHPDVVSFQEIGLLKVISETPDLGKAHDFNGIKAISQGSLVRGIDEPIPVTPVKNLVGINPRLIV